MTGVEGADRGDFCRSFGMVLYATYLQKQTSVQGRRDPACEHRGPYGVLEAIQGTYSMSCFLLQF
jgi:hypothetical protein